MVVLAEPQVVALSRVHSDERSEAEVAVGFISIL